MHPFPFLRRLLMKGNRKTSVKPRNRESKNHGAHIPPVEECRHLWMDGVCMKCGIREEDAAAEKK